MHREGIKEGQRLQLQRLVDCSNGSETQHRFVCGRNSTGRGTRAPAAHIDAIKEGSRLHREAYRQSADLHHRISVATMNDAGRVISVRECFRALPNPAMLTIPSRRSLSQSVGRCLNPSAVIPTRRLLPQAVAADPPSTPLAPHDPLVSPSPSSRLARRRNGPLPSRNRPFVWVRLRVGTFHYLTVTVGYKATGP